MEIGPTLGGGRAWASGLWPNRADNLSRLERILSNVCILQMWKLNSERPNDLPRPYCESRTWRPHFLFFLAESSVFGKDSRKKKKANLSSLALSGGGIF